MTRAEYKAERKLRGTQTAVAAQLGVTQVTMARRETGVSPVTKEMWLALLALPKKRKKKNVL
ncbi:MAG: helix-turn-helix transcriptional regulator [Patescibacteria group bacterium]|nr:helix-turn-helix transcriptional regulator [Patescibacteria group bacterium]